MSEIDMEIDFFRWCRLEILTWVSTSILLIGGLWQHLFGTKIGANKNSLEVTGISSELNRLKVPLH